MARSDFAQTKTYNAESDFSVGSNIEWDNGLKLKLEDNPGQDYEEDFADDTGHTYDSDVSEFSGGKWQQKPDLLDSALCGTNYFDDGNADLMFGSGDLTGSVVEGAISGGVANLQGATGNRKYLQYDNPEDFLAGSELRGTMIFTWTAGDTFSPSINHGIWNTDRVTDFNWQTALFYDAGVGGLRLIMFNGTGGTQITLNYVWTPTQGQTHEIALAYDFEITGTVSIYVDKTRVATVTSATYLTIFAAKSYAGMRLRLGTDRIAAWYADCEFDGWIHYDEYLLTGATYTEDYAMSNFYYSDSYDTLPEIEYTGAGALVSLDSFTYTKTGDALVALQIGRSGVWTYWNGSAWITGDGTKDYMCTFADFASNVSTLDIDGEIYGQFKVFLPESNTVGDVDEVTASLTAQIYPTTNPMAETTVLTSDELLSFASLVTASGSDTIKLIIKRDDDWIYHDGSSWTTSDKTYSQSNTSAEVTANFPDLSNDDENNYYVGIFFHSNDGTTTPVLSSITIKYFALNFVVEDGVGKIDSTSYATVAQFYQYWIDRGTDYSSSSTTDIKQWLNSATDYIDDSYVYKGSETNDDQSLDWPRYYVEKENGRTYYENDEIPEEIIKAICYLASKASDGELSPEESLLRSYSIGPISKTYAGSSTVTSYPLVDKLLKHLIKQGNEIIRVN